MITASYVLQRQSRARQKATTNGEKLNSLNCTFLERERERERERESEGRRSRQKPLETDKKDRLIASSE